MRERNGFIGNDLSSADLVDVDFRGGIDLTKQILPSGPDYIYIADTGMAARIAGELAAELDPAQRIRSELNHCNKCSSSIIPMDKSSSYCDCPDVTN